MTYKMIVRKFVFEKNRVLLYGDDPEFKVIALLSELNGIKLGDEVEYEPKGINFGWIVKPVKPVTVVVDDGDKVDCLYVEDKGDEDKSNPEPVSRRRNNIMAQHIANSTAKAIERNRNRGKK